MAFKNVLLLIIAVKMLVLFKGTTEHSIKNTGRQAEWQRKLWKVQPGTLFSSLGYS